MGVMDMDEELDNRQEAAAQINERVTWWANGQIDHEELAADIRQLAQNAEDEEEHTCNDCGSTDLRPVLTDIRTVKCRNCGWEYIEATDD